MKIFTAAEFNKEPSKVYREVDRNGSAKINHNDYKDRIFILTSKERGVETEYNNSDSDAGD